MDLADSPEEATFRTTAREWLSWALPQLSRPEPADLAARAPFWRQWQRMAFEARVRRPVMAEGVRRRRC
jgi:hypothetical protein